MANKVEIIVSATDKATGVFKGLGGSIANLGKLALGAAGIAGIGGLTLALKNSIGAASDLSETYNKVGVVFGDAQDAVVEFSKNAAASLGQSQQSALDAASTFGVFGKAAGLMGDDLASFSLDLTSLASDLASFYNADPSEVIVALGAALRGESEPMRKFGVLLDDATLKAKALELGIISTTKEALTPANKVLAANAVILEQTSDAQGDFARTSTGLANSQRIIKAGLEDLSATFGKAFLPIVEKVFGYVSANVIPVLGNMAEAFGSFAEILFSGDIAGAFDMIAQAVTSAFGAEAGAKISEFGSWLTDVIPQAIQFLSDTWTNTLVPALQLAWQWIQEKLLPLFVAVGQYLIAVIPPAVQFFANVWTGTLLPAIQTVWAWFSDTFIPFLTNEVLPWLTENMPIAIQNLSTFWTEVLQPAMMAVWEWISTVLMPFLTGVVFPWIAENLPIAIQKLSDFWSGVLWPAIQAVWEWMSTVLIPFFADVVFPWISENLPIALQKLSDFWTNTLKPAIETVWAWMTGTLIPLLSDLFVWINDTLTSAIQSLTNFWLETLWPALQDIWAWVDENLIPLFVALQELFDVGLTLAVTAMAGLWQNVLFPAIEAIWLIIQDNVMPMLETFIAYFNDTIKPILEGIVDGVLTDLKLIWGGISGAIGGVTSAVQKLIDKLKGLKLPPIFTPGSPTPAEIGFRGIADAVDAAGKSTDKFINSWVGIGAPGGIGDLLGGGFKGIGAPGGISDIIGGGFEDVGGGGGIGDIISGEVRNGIVDGIDDIKGQEWIGGPRGGMFVGLRNSLGQLIEPGKLADVAFESAGKSGIPDAISDGVVGIIGKGFDDLMGSVWSGGGFRSIGQPGGIGDIIGGIFENVGRGGIGDLLGGGGFSDVGGGGTGSISEGIGLIERAIVGALSRGGGTTINVIYQQPSTGSLASDLAVANAMAGGFN